MHSINPLSGELFIQEQPYIGEISQDFVFNYKNDLFFFCGT